MGSIPNKIKVFLFFSMVFMAALPIANTINYEQNDEWVYYQNIRRFSQGNYELLPNTAPSFYTAGFPALLVAKIAGLHKIPILTLFISVYSGFILALIINEHLKKNIAESLIFSLLFLFNPLFVYSSWGFMTDNYAVFYMLLSVYFFLKPPGKRSSIHFLLGTLLAFCAFFTRQVYIVIPLAFSAHALFQRNYKKLLFHFMVFIFISVFYYTLFPKTPEMFDNNLLFSNLTYFRYIFSLSNIVLIYLISLLLPIVIVFIKHTFKSKDYLKLAVIIIIAVIATIGANIYFKPSIVWNEKYYYLINTVQRKGFLADNLHGSKFDFVGFPHVYNILDITAKILGIYVIIKLLITKKSRFINFYSVFMILYLGLILISPKIHDRYLIPLFIPFLLLILSQIKPLNPIEKISTAFFVLLIGYYSYNFSMDYILTNKYVWEKSTDLVNVEHVDPGEIVSTIAWNLKYPSTQKGHRYKFTYDSPNEQNYSTDYKLIEKVDVSFPLSFWKGNTICLYEYKEQNF